MKTQNQKKILLFPIKKQTPINKLINCENKKTPIVKNEFKKQLVYKPIHEQYPFCSSSLGINEILKPQTFSLIKNSALRNIIIKFLEERKKSADDKNLFYRNQSASYIRKYPNNNIINQKEKIPKKLIKINRNGFYNNSNQNLNSSSNAMTLNNSNIYNKNKRKIIWNKDIGHKSQDKKNKYLSENAKKRILKLKRDVKIKGAGFSSITGTLNPLKISSSNYRKINQNLCFSNINIKSEKLGSINMFGIFEGNGPHGKQITLILKNYLLKYFEKSTEMRVCQKKDNYYSIMYDAFVNTQNYLYNQKNYNNNISTNINPEFSGATGIVIVYPNNLSNKVYCANNGKCKCLLYTTLGTVKLSYEFSPKRASEKERIEEFQKQFLLPLKQKEYNEKEFKETDIPNDENIKNDNIKIKTTNNNDSANAEKIKKLLNEEMKTNLIKKLEEMDLSRCFGNFAVSEIGIIPDPEVVECDVRVNKGKFIVIGTASLWKYLSDEEIGAVVKKYLLNNDCAGACKELEDLAREQWQLNSRYVEDISVVVIFFDAKL